MCPFMLCPFMLMCPFRVKFMLAASRVEQDASKEGELLPLHLTDSPGVRARSKGQRRVSAWEADMGSAPRQSLCDRITRQQKWVTRLHAGGGSGSQELGVGPAGCERIGADHARDGGLPQASP